MLESFTYVSDSNSTSGLVASYTVGNTTYTYTYDNVGNITLIHKNDDVYRVYAYDTLNQLVSETIYPDTGSAYQYRYSYDKSGNITNVQYDSNWTIQSMSYTYGNSSWGDLLTNYNGTAITYDAIGNPTNWRNASILSWQGRSLIVARHTDGTYTGYAYNADGIRTAKIYMNAQGDEVGAVNYTLDGSTIVAENRNGTNIYYTYDDKGSIMGMIYDGDTYMFSKNLQGDVIGIYNENRQLVAKYEYNAYGEITSATDLNGSGIATINPFRYRGYYYDTETGFYYLQSRYYDPVVGRFLNADAFVSTGQGILGNNMFAYCLNNPVMQCDDNGKLATFVIPMLPVLPLLSPLEDAVEFFVNGFLDAIEGGIKGIRDYISNAKKDAEARRAEKQASKAREYAASKTMERLNNLNDDECAIVYIDGKTSVIYKVMYVRDVIPAMQEDILAGTNLVIPANQENWGVFTAKKEKALMILFCTFGSAKEDHSWRGHSPLPHFNTIPHKIKINRIETTPHAWFLY